MTLACFTRLGILDTTRGARVVNNELEKRGISFRVNKLSLNINKTNVIMFAKKTNIDQR